MKKISKDETPANKRMLYKQMSSEIQQKAAGTQEGVVELITNKAHAIGSQEKNLALQLAEENKMLEAIPGLYELLKEVTVSGVGERVKDPAESLIAIGKDGLAPLLNCMENDQGSNIPYLAIAAILYHWFGNDKASLRLFLAEKKNAVSGAIAAKYEELINVVDSWK